MEKISKKLFSTTCSRFNQKERFIINKTGDQLKKARSLSQKNLSRVRLYNLDVDEDEDFFKTQAKTRKLKSSLLKKKVKYSRRLKPRKSIFFLFNFFFV